MKARQILSLAVLVSFSGLFSPPFAEYAHGLIDPTAGGSVINALSSAGVPNVAASAAAAAECAAYVVGGPFTPCTDLTLGLPTWGMCIAPAVCLGLGTIGIVAAGAGIAQSIFGGSNSGSAGAYPPGFALPNGSVAGCAGTPHISATPSSDPCLVYIPPETRARVAGNTGNTSTSVSTLLTSNTTGAGATSVSSVSNTLSNNSSGGLGGFTVSNGFNSLLNLGQGTANNTSAPYVSSSLGNYGANTVNQSNASANAGNIPPRPSGVQSGTWGDIQVSAFGVTITAGAHDTDGRTGITGFYGYDSVQGIQPQMLARQMCNARPWASSSATPVIQPSFFDNICEARGYSATITASAPNAGASANTASNNSDAKTTSGASKANTGATSTRDSLQWPVLAVSAPRVDIYAIPTRVRIGARSNIYWSARGVTSCAISSPDGSFNEDTLSGAAGTVALYENTAFTITCDTPTGSIVTKSVTVETSD